MAEGPTRYCWACYAKQDPAAAADRCDQCGQSPVEPAGATFTDKLLWSLHHPLVERRIIAALALAQHREPRAVQPLREMAYDPDPYLAAAAVRALAYYPGVTATLRDVAEHGPAPARRAARAVLAAGEPPGQARVTFR